MFLLSPRHRYYLKTHCFSFIFLFVILFSSQKSKTCRRCKPPRVFARQFNLKLHMRTVHKNFVQKFICPICKLAISNVTNLRVHYKRKHKTSKLTDGKIKKLKQVRIDASKLMNGRFYKSITSSESDVSIHSDSSEDDLPLSHVAQHMQWLKSRVRVTRCIPTSSDESNEEHEILDLEYVDVPGQPLVQSVEEHSFDDHQSNEENSSFSDHQQNDEFFEMLIPECTLEVGQSPLRLMHEVEQHCDDGIDDALRQMFEPMETEPALEPSQNLYGEILFETHTVTSPPVEVDMQLLQRVDHGTEGEILCQTFTVHNSADNRPASKANRIWMRRYMPSNRRIPRSMVNYTERMSPMSPYI